MERIRLTIILKTFRGITTLMRGGLAGSALGCRLNGLCSNPSGSNHKSRVLAKDSQPLRELVIQGSGVRTSPPMIFVEKEGSGQEFDGRGQVGYLCSRQSQSQTCCGRSSSVLLP
ncbi:hypothetical protein TNCV_4553561 [Trichonephila clavipes]|nr:hypothetical protein TNCV_4553561 [Trichonephila clavipes]